jgi:putative spermidine/putrescine transport system permease protein
LRRDSWTASWPFNDVRTSITEQVGAAPVQRRTNHVLVRQILLVAPALLFLILFLVVPLFGLFRASFYPTDLPFGGVGFSLRHYERFLGDTYYLSVLAETIGFGAAAAFISLVIGFPVGYSLGRLPPDKRRWRLIIVILPLTLSLVVVVFGWLVILGGGGLVNSVLMGLGLMESPQRLLFNRAAVLVVLVQQFLPFMILSVMSVVAQIDPVLEQAAANLRANRFRTFRKVVLPLAMPGILVGLTLVFILTASAFITPRLIGGARVQMVGSLIFEQVLVILNWPFGAAMSFILLVITLALTVIVNVALAARFMSRGSRHAG